MTKKDENLFDPEEENKKAQELAKKQQEEAGPPASKKGEKELGSQGIEPDQSMQPPKHTESPPQKESKGK